MPAEQPPFPTTVTEEATSRLRMSILTGELAPGARLLIGELVEMFGISHIPIRESLRRLEGEGLVENRPRRGTVVSDLSLAELAEVYDLRRLLEPTLARRAVEAADPGREKLLKAALHDLETVASEPASEEFIERHRRYHALMLDVDNTDLRQRVLRQLWQNAERYVRLALTVGLVAPRAAVQHRALLDAYLSHDGERVETELINHLETTEAAVRSCLEARPAADGNRWVH